MLVPSKILFLIALAAWGTAAFISLIPFPSEMLPTKGEYALTAFGVIVGFPLTGFFADRFGRFRVLYGCFFLAPVFYTVYCLAFSIIGDFLVLRFLIAVFCAGLYLTPVLLLFEQNDARFRRQSLTLLPALTLLFAAVFISRHFHFALIFLLWIPSMFLIIRYNDEPARWKIAVRDRKQKGRTQRTVSINLRKWGGRILLTFTILFCVQMISVKTVERMIPPQEGATELQDRAFAYLIRFPQLLNTKKFNDFDFDTLGEQLTAHRPLPQTLFRALVSLQKKGKTVNRKNLLNQALVERDPARNPSEIPLDEIERFWKQAGAFLDKSQNMLEQTLALQHQEESIGNIADTWTHRRVMLNEMLTQVERTVRLQVLHRETVNRSCLLVLYFFLACVLSLFHCNLFVLLQVFSTSIRGTGIGISIAACLLFLYFLPV